MFDLDKEVAAWSSTMAQRCGREADIAELEDHLRSAFEHLSAEGVPPERAFELAVSRMGSVADIDAEYEKNRSLFSKLHSKVVSWDRSLTKGSRSGQEIGLALIFASLIIAVAVLLSSTDLDGTTAASYLLLVSLPLWWASRALIRGR